MLARTPDVHMGDDVTSSTEERLLDIACIARSRGYEFLRSDYVPVKQLRTVLTKCHFLQTRTNLNSL